METATIVKQTKDYMLIKVLLPRRADFKPTPIKKSGRMSTAEKRLWRIIQEGERDLRDGRTITAPSIKEALRRYDKRKWD